jgi:uncharacterized damage-inducible protein DinB
MEMLSMSDHKQMIEDYLAGPTLLRKAVGGMSREQLTARPVAGKMSTLEVVCHLADFDPIIADRMKRIIALDNPPLSGADENRFLATLAYQERDLEEELVLVEKTRSQMARILRQLPESAWARTGQHSERGPLTLEQLLALGIRHIVHHLKFIQEKRQALGLAVA